MLGTFATLFCGSVPAAFVTAEPVSTPDPDPETESAALDDPAGDVAAPSDGVVQALRTSEARIRVTTAVAARE
jgi:hypothetical protein